MQTLGERDEADTVTQEVFLKAYSALVDPGASEVADPARWLTRVAVNACLDRLRSRRWRFWRQRPAPDDEQAILERNVYSRLAELCPDMKDLLDERIRKLRVEHFILF